MGSSSSPETTELTIVVTVHDAQDRGGTLEYGLQSKMGELDGGTPNGDGGVRYECTALNPAQIRRLCELHR